MFVSRYDFFHKKKKKKKKHHWSQKNALNIYINFLGKVIFTLGKWFKAFSHLEKDFGTPLKYIHKKNKYISSRVTLNEYLGHNKGDPDLGFTSKKCMHFY